MNNGFLTGGPVFDKDVILELIDLSKEAEPSVLEQILNNFRQSAPQWISEIQSGYSANDLEAVEKAAHKLKGSAGMLGLSQLTSKASEVMIAARKKESIDPEKNIQDLREIFKITLDEVSTFINNHRD